MASYITNKIRPRETFVADMRTVIDLRSFEQTYRVNETRLIEDNEVFDIVCSNMADFFCDKEASKILAKTTTGMVFGAAVAEKLNLPLVIAGEVGKMPGQSININFVDDYGRYRSFAIDSKLVKSDDHFGIIENLTYSGRTTAALGCLIEQTGNAKVVGCSSVVKFPFDHERAWFNDWFKHHELYSFFSVNAAGEKTVHGKDIKKHKNIVFRPMDIKTIKETMINIFPNFPSNGIMWTEYNNILATPDAYNTVTKMMADHYKDSNIDLVLSLGVRGLHFGTWIANKLGVGQVLALKPEKLNWKKDIVQYSLEYTKNAEMAIEKAAIKEGSRVLIVDDILATGGTAEAATRLVHLQGGIVAGITCMIGLTDVMENSQVFRNNIRLFDYFTLLNFTSKELIKKGKGRYF